MLPVNGLDPSGLLRGHLPLMGRLSRGFARANVPFPQVRRRGLDPLPQMLPAYFPAGFFRFLIIPSKYTPYTAIAAALTQADTFNPGVW